MKKEVQKPAKVPLDLSLDTVCEEDKTQHCWVRVTYGKQILNRIDVQKQFPEQHRAGNHSCSSQVRVEKPH